MALCGYGWWVEMLMFSVVAALLLSKCHIIDSNV